MLLHLLTFREKCFLILLLYLHRIKTKKAQDVNLGKQFLQNLTANTTQVQKKTYINTENHLPPNGANTGRKGDLYNVKLKIISLCKKTYS